MPVNHALPTTERLALRRFTPDDLDFLDRMNSDEEVMRHVGGVKDRAKTEEILKTRILDYYEQHPGLGIWATLERAGGACIGMHLLNHIQGEAHIQVGYVLLRPYWGLGYATEMSIALLHFGFEKLGLAQIVAITDLPNFASQHVLLKAGLHRHGERTLAHPAYGGEPLAWFECAAADWLAEHRTGSRTRSADGSPAIA